MTFLRGLDERLRTARLFCVTDARLGTGDLPGFAAAVAHYDQARAPRLNAALTQGLRDYFGAHTYRRIDREGTFHVNWSTDGAEIQES